MLYRVEIVGLRLMLKKALSPLWLALFLCHHLAAQEKVVIHQSQSWLEYSSLLKLNGRYSLLVDGGYRWVDTYLAGEMYYVRAGGEYAVSENISLHLGFAHVGYFFDYLSQVEHRPYQEISINNKIYQTHFYQRFRIEERFFQPIGSEYSRPFNWFNWRFRYMLMIDLPLWALSKSKPEYRISFGIGDEILMNAGENIQHNYFDHNRFLLSPTVHFGTKLSISITYMNQYSSTFSQGRFFHSQVFWLQVRQKFELRHGIEVSGARE